MFLQDHTVKALSAHDYGSTCIRASCAHVMYMQTKDVMQCLFEGL